MPKLKNRSSKFENRSPPDEFRIPGFQFPASIFQFPVSISFFNGSITPSPNDKLLAYSIANDPTNFNSYSVWICESGSTNPIRVTPLTTSGYLAPVWIDDSSLGAVRVSEKSCDAVILNRFTHKSKFVCALPTADLSWSPDRSRIICAREQLQTDQSVPHLMVIGTGVKI